MTKQKRKMRLMTYKKRQVLEKLLNQNMAIDLIADFLNVNRSTIYRELQRCEKDRYTADEAQKTVIYIAHDPDDDRFSSL